MIDAETKVKLFNTPTEKQKFLLIVNNYYKFYTLLGILLHYIKNL